MKKNKGISLIVLIITIIIILILAGTVILSLAQNNAIDKAREAKFKTDVDAFKNDLQLWISNEYLTKPKNFNSKDVNADNTTNGYENKKITDIITSMNNEYASKFIIKEGQLIYIGSDANEKDWMNDMGVTVSDISAEILNPLQWLKSTDMITDWLSNATTLSNGGVTNVPYARVLWNYNKNTKMFSNYTNNPKATMLSNAMVANALLDAYESTGDDYYRARAVEIGDQIGGLIIWGTIYDDTPHAFIVSQETNNNGWADEYSYVYTQDMALAAIVQYRLYLITHNTSYRDNGEALMETLCWAQDYADYTTVAGGGGPYPNAISGGIHEYFVRQSGNVFYPSETTFSLGNADMLVTAFQTAYQATNDIGYKNRLDWYTWFLQNVMENYGGMNAQGYVYEYYADIGTGWKAQNYDQLDNNWGENEPFTTDMFFYTALGVAKVDSTLGAKLLSTAGKMQNNNLFYGQYKMDGTPDNKNDDNSVRSNEFESINTGMYLELIKLMDPTNTDKMQSVKASIVDIMTKDVPSDKNAQYAFEWSTNAHDGVIESIATGKIISCILK